MFANRLTVLLKAERYEKVSQTDAYKDSDDKTRFMHDELAKIKDDEATFRKNKKEEAQAALQNWLRTGENPPVGMDDVSEAERLAMYQQTDEYKNYQAGMVAWAAQQQADAQRQAFSAFLREEREDPVVSAPDDAPWWQTMAANALQVVDQNQTLMAIGIGVAVGIGAVAIIASGGLAAPLVIGGAALLAGGLTAGATIALNTNYNRSWNQNLISNVGISATAAGVIALAPPVLQTLTPAISLGALNIAGLANTVGLPFVAHMATIAAPWVGLGWTLGLLGGMTFAGIGASAANDPTLPADVREKGTEIGLAGATTVQAMLDIKNFAEIVNANSPLKVTNPAPEETGLTPIMQQAITNAIPADGTQVAVRTPAEDAEYGAPFLPQKPEGANSISNLPLGIRKALLSDGSTSYVVSDLDPAWAMNNDGELLPESFFINDGINPSFGESVNNTLGYDAVQHPDHINGVLLKPDHVPFEKLFEPVTIMDSNGYVGSSSTMLDSLLDYNPNGEKIITQILEVAPPDVAQQITNYLAGR